MPGSLGSFDSLTCRYVTVLSAGGLKQVSVPASCVGLILGGERQEQSTKQVGVGGERRGESQQARCVERDAGGHSEEVTLSRHWRGVRKRGSLGKAECQDPKEGAGLACSRPV